MNDQDIQAFVYTGANWLVNAIPNLLAAVVILAAGYMIAKWLSRLVSNVMLARTHADPTLTPVIASLIRYFILIITFIAVLGQLGVQIASMLAVLGAAGLAIGLALQGTLSNIAAGLMLLWLRPFRAGETIDAKGIVGTVTEVGLFATTLRTGDGLFHFVPNSSLWNVPILNKTRNPTRRVDIVFAIDYGDDISKARDALTAMAEADNRVLPQPQMEVVVTGMDDKAVALTLRAWVKAPDYAKAAPDLSERGKIALERAGIFAPYPRHVVQPAVADPLPGRATENAT